jgi:hypothetical protein
MVLKVWKIVGAPIHLSVEEVTVHAGHESQAEVNVDSVLVAANL